MKFLQLIPVEGKDLCKIDECDKFCRMNLFQQTAFKEQPSCKRVFDSLLIELSSFINPQF